MRPAALLIDLDGTLLDSNDWISEPDIEAIRRAAEVIPVAIASGRVPEDVGHFARLLGLSSPQVCDNGARLFDPLRGRTLSRLPIHSDDARMIVERIQDAGLKFFAVDSGRVARSYAEFTEWQVTVITCAVSDRDAAESMAQEHSGNGVTAMGSRGSRDEWYVNYTHAEAHKGYGAARFSESVGVDLSDVMAIGDGLNDRELFQAVGLPVAMGHAPDHIKALAEHVTAPLEEHGVARAIERFVLTG